VCVSGGLLLEGAARGSLAIGPNRTPRSIAEHNPNIAGLAKYRSVNPPLQSPGSTTGSDETEICCASLGLKHAGTMGKGSVVSFKRRDGYRYLATPHARRSAGHY
jgi:hypothetical protein